MMIGKIGMRLLGIENLKLNFLFNQADNRRLMLRHSGTFR